MSAIKPVILSNLQSSNNKKSNEQQHQQLQQHQQQQQQQQLSSKFKRNSDKQIDLINQNSKQCIFCQKQLAKNRAEFFSQMIIRALYSKYASSQNYYYTKDLNEIIANAKSSVVIIYKDNVTYDEEEEYLKRFYRINEYDYKIKMLSEYYKFHRDIARIFMLPTSLILNKYHDRKRRLEYIRITKMLKEENQSKISNKQSLLPKKEEVKPLSLPLPSPLPAPIQDRILDNLKFTDNSTVSQNDDIKIYNDNINQFTDRIVKKTTPITFVTASLDPHSNNFFIGGAHKFKPKTSEKVDFDIKKNEKNAKTTEPVFDYSREGSLSNTLQDLNNKLGEIITSSGGMYNPDGTYMDSIDPILANNNNETFSNLSNFLNFLKTKPNTQPFLNTRGPVINKDNNTNINNILHIENLQEVNPNFIHPQALYPKPVLKTSQSTTNIFRQKIEKPVSAIGNIEGIMTPKNKILSRKNSKDNVLLTLPIISQGVSPSNNHKRTLNDKYDNNKMLSSQQSVPELITKNSSGVPLIGKVSSDLIQKTKPVAIFTKIQNFEEALTYRDKDRGRGRDRDRDDGPNTHDSQRSHKSLSRENSQKHTVVNIPSQQKSVPLKTLKDNFRPTSSSKYMNSTIKQGSVRNSSVSMKTSTEFSNFHQKSKSTSVNNNKTSSTMTPSLMNSKYTVKSTNVVNLMIKKESVEREKMTNIMKRVEGVINEQNLKVHHSRINSFTTANQKLTPTAVITAANLNPGLPSSYAIANPIFANNKSQAQLPQYTLIDKGMGSINTYNQLTKTKASFSSTNLKPSVKNELYQVPQTPLTKKIDSANASTCNNQDIDVESNITKPSSNINGYNHVISDNSKQLSGIKHTKNDGKLLLKDDTIIKEASDIYNRTNHGKFLKYPQTENKDKTCLAFTNLGSTHVNNFGNDYIDPLSKKKRASLPHNPSIYTYNHNNIVNIYLDNEKNKKNEKNNQSPQMNEKPGLNEFSNENQQLSECASVLTNKLSALKPNGSYNVLYNSSSHSNYCNEILIL